MAHRWSIRLYRSNSLSYPSSSLGRRNLINQHKLSATPYTKCPSTFLFSVGPLISLRSIHSTLPSSYGLLVCTQAGLEISLQKELQKLNINATRLPHRSGAVLISANRHSENVQSENKDSKKALRLEFAIGHRDVTLSLWEICQMLHLQCRLASSVWLQVTPQFRWTDAKDLEDNVKRIKWHKLFVNSRTPDPIRHAAIRLWATGDSRFRRKRDIIRQILPLTQIDRSSMSLKSEVTERQSDHSIIDGDRHSGMRLIKTHFDNTTISETLIPFYLDETESSIRHMVGFDISAGLCTAYVQLISTHTDLRNSLELPTHHSTQTPTPDFPIWRKILRHKKSDPPSEKACSSWSLASSQSSFSGMVEIPTAEMDDGSLCSKTSNGTSRKVGLDIQKEVSTDIVEETPLSVLAWTVQTSCLAPDTKQMETTRILHKYHPSRNSEKPPELAGDPIIVWDPFCRNGSLLRECLSQIFDLPATSQFGNNGHRVPLLDLLGGDWTWLKSASEIWDSNRSRNLALLDHVSAIGTDNQIDIPKIRNWTSWLDAYIPNSLTSAKQSNQRYRLNGVDWEGLIHQCDPILITSSVIPEDIMSSTFDQNHLPNSLTPQLLPPIRIPSQNTLVPNDFVLSQCAIKLGLFSSASPELIAQRLERPLVITEFPGSAAELKTDFNSRLRFCKNLEIFDRLISSGGPWRQVLVLSRTKRFSVRSKLVWKELGQCRDNEGGSYYLLEWVGEYKSSWRSFAVDLLDDDLED